MTASEQPRTTLAKMIAATIPLAANLEYSLAHSQGKNPVTILGWAGELPLDLGQPLGDDTRDEIQLGPRPAPPALHVTECRRASAAHLASGPLRRLAKGGSLRHRQRRAHD